MKKSELIEQQISELKAKLTQAKKSLVFARKQELEDGTRARLKLLEKSGVLDLTDLEIKQMLAQISARRGLEK